MMSPVESSEDTRMFASNDLKHAIKSLTGSDVSDDFIAVMQKQLEMHGNTEIDFQEFSDSFLQMTQSLYPIQASNNPSRRGSNPPSPPPSPTLSHSFSSSPISTPPDLISPPNSPRNSDSSPVSSSPMSASPPNFFTIHEFTDASPTTQNHLASFFVKPNPISPRRLGQGRARSSSLGAGAQRPRLSLSNDAPAAVVPVFNDDQGLIRGGKTSPEPPIMDGASSSPLLTRPSPMLKHETSHNDLFMTLMSLNNDNGNGAFTSNVKKQQQQQRRKKKQKNRAAYHNDDSELCSEDEGAPSPFSMDTDWESPSKPRRYNYKAHHHGGEEIGWATEEFYYDPTLNRLDELHEVASILKEKYTISSSKVKELEKKIQMTLRTNQQLEDELEGTKKEYITMSLKNNALIQNKNMSDQMLDDCNQQLHQLKHWKLNTEKEMTQMKKKLTHYEELASKTQKSLEDTQWELESRDIRHHQDIENINNKHGDMMEKIQIEFQYEVNIEKERYFALSKKAEQENNMRAEENARLREMIETLNQQVYQLRNICDEKQKEIDENNLNKNKTENMSHELLTTETNNLNHQLQGWKKRCQRMEAKKIVDLKKELKRSKKEHSDYESLIMQGIQDFNNIGTSIDNKLKNQHQQRQYSDINNNNNSNNNSNTSNSSHGHDRPSDYKPPPVKHGPP
ncbi:hypothetical protein SAMD00019534_039730, partial [Acytostelium subglobosum LB1]|uniref:hypothetical protein n=1 Tax=Acytostelium subglobosum LB1 TaxID=1410327 RepID=UPI000644D517